jgi:hypothetical protein
LRVQAEPRTPEDALLRMTDLLSRFVRLSGTQRCCSMQRATCNRRCNADSIRHTAGMLWQCCMLCGVCCVSRVARCMLLICCDRPSLSAGASQAATSTCLHLQSSCAMRRRLHGGRERRSCSHLWLLLAETPSGLVVDRFATAARRCRSSSHSARSSRLIVLPFEHCH